MVARMQRTLQEGYSRLLTVAPSIGMGEDGNLDLEPLDEYGTFSPLLARAAAEFL